MRTRLNKLLCVLSLLIFGALNLSLSALSWDGNWTDARSGNDYIYDPKNSQGKAGSDPPQTFYTPPLRDSVNVDPEELDDYFKKKGKIRDYVPYALLRVSQSLRYNDKTISKGYYTVKAGDWSDGSPRTHLNTPIEAAIVTPSALPPLENTSTPSAPPLPGNTTRSKSSNRLPNSQSHTTSGSPNPTAMRQTPLNKKFPIQRVFIIKRLGNVIAVVPIHQVEPYFPKREDLTPKKKIPKQALAWVEMDGQRPILKFYYKHWLYSTTFQ